MAEFSSQLRSSYLPETLLYYLSKEKELKVSYHDKDFKET